jgi:signal transduction histidine kinase
VIAGQFRLRPPLRLGTRIAAMTMTAILAVQALNAAAFWLLPPPKMTVYGARWLIGRIEKAVPAIFAASEKDRPLLAGQAGARSSLQIHWEPKGERNQPDPPRLGPPPLDRVRASLEKDLEKEVRMIIIRDQGPPGPNFERDLVFLPPDFMKRLPMGPVTPAEAEIPIFGEFEIAIQGLDGSWLSVQPQKQPRLAAFPHPLFVTLIGAVILVLGLSTFTAKRSLRPLDRLVAAAQKLGHTREVAPVPLAGLNEFAVIAAAMNEMQSRIKQFLDERTQMLAAISHDLRTPLTRLRLKAEDLSDSQIKDQLIEDLGEMELMISATLTFAGDDLKREPQERIDLAALLISLCDGFSDRQQLAYYSGPNHAHLLCQKAATKRAFDNLIGNAIKYGARAEVNLAISGGTAFVSIADNGPGIPFEQVELAFQPFRRLEDSRNRESGGVGLGLAIARDIIRAHGGEIDLRNRPEGGLEALVRLPTHVAAHPPSKVPAASKR